MKAEITPPSDESTPFDMEFSPVEVDLERIVRKVVRYESLSDLNQNKLEKGGFHVVYPDPLFRECEDVTRRANETKTLNYTNAYEVYDDEDLEADDITPDKMWWFSWLISHVAEGVPMPVSWFCDESKVLFENGAEKADHNLPRFIRAAGDKYIDMRRSGLSMYLIGHNLKGHFSHHIRKLMRWGVTMNGKRNPVNEQALSGSAPMNTEIASKMDVGEAVFWNAARDEYSEFNWSPIADRYRVPGKLRLTYPGIQEVKEAC